MAAQVAQMSGGTGDADLYVRYGTQPTTSSYNCRPYLNGNNETCTISNPQAGTWYVSVRAYSTYSGLSLTAVHNGSGDPGEEPPTGSIEETGLSGSQGSWQHFTIEVAGGAAELVAEIDGGSGDADLYVRRGAQPTTSSYDCRPYKYGNIESCTFSNPQAGTWYVSVRAYSSYSGLNLNAAY